MNIWIVCGSQSGAKIYRCRDLRQGLEFVTNYPHPEGRLKERELLTDHEGERSSDQGAKSVRSTSVRESARLGLAEDFAQFLSHEIDKAVDGRSFDSLILCADPKFLGMIRSKLSRRAENKVIGSLNENFYNSDADRLFKSIRDVITDGIQKRLGEIA
jgi:protein required for attachment to host cells